MADSNLEGIEIKVGSDVQYEQLTAEIFIDGKFFGRVTEEAGPRLFEIEIHPRRDGQPWVLKLAEVEDAIGQAVRRLTTLWRES